MANRYLLTDGKESFYRIATLLARFDHWEKVSKILSDLNIPNPKVEALKLELAREALLLLHELDRLKKELEASA